MGFYPFNPLLSQIMQTNVSAKNVDISYIAHLKFTAAEAVAADADGVHVAAAVSADSVVSVTTELTNPPCPRNATATVGGTAGSIKAVQVTVIGTNFNDEVISEALPAFTADTAGIVAGSKIFKTITGYSTPAMDGAGVTVALGFGDKLGLPFLLSHNTVLATYLDNVLESTKADVAVSATLIEGNSIDLYSDLNGKAVDAYVIV